MEKFKNHLYQLADNEILNVESSKECVKDGDLCIAVMDRGWVFVGFMNRMDNGRILLKSAYNVHRWGTKEGLGEIAVNGPTEDTVLYDCGDIYGAPIFLMSADIEKWLTSK